MNFKSPKILNFDKVYKSLQFHVPIQQVIQFFFQRWTIQLQKNSFLFNCVLFPARAWHYEMCCAVETYKYTIIILMTYHKWCRCGMKCVYFIGLDFNSFYLFDVKICMCKLVHITGDWNVISIKQTCLSRHHKNETNWIIIWYWFDWTANYFIIWI